MRGPAGGWPEQTAADAATSGSTVGAVTGVCRMRGPAGGWPEHTAGGLRGALPPGLGGPGGYPPGLAPPRRRRRTSRTIAAVPITATVAPAAVIVASFRSSRRPATV